MQKVNAQLQYAVMFSAKSRARSRKWSRGGDVNGNRAYLRKVWSEVRENLHSLWWWRQTFSEFSVD